MRGNALSETRQPEPSESAERPPEPPAASGVVTSSCTGSGFSLRISPLEDIGGAELDLEAGGGGGGEAKGSRLRTVDDGEERVESGDPGGPGVDGGGVLRDLKGRRAQGKPRLEMISLSVSIGEPLTDHSVIPI